MKLKQLFYFSILITVILFTPAYCPAQDSIKLNEVVKIEFIAKTGGFFTSTYRALEVSKNHNVWNAWQTRLFEAYSAKTHERTNDSSKRFIKAIPAEKLNGLLILITQQDTGIQLGLFNIDKAELVNDMDSLNFHIGVEPNTDDYPLTPQNRLVFTKLLQTDSIVNRAALHLLHHRKWDDESVYTIRVTTRNKAIVTATAFNLAYPYYLPWHTGAGLSYNPNISLIFEEIMGNDKYAAAERKMFHKSIDREIYRAYILHGGTGQNIH